MKTFFLLIIFSFCVVSPPRGALANDLLLEMCFTEVADIAYQKKIPLEKFEELLLVSCEHEKRLLRNRIELDISVGENLRFGEETSDWLKRRKSGQQLLSDAQAAFKEQEGFVRRNAISKYELRLRDFELTRDTSNI